MAEANRRMKYPMSKPLLAERFGPNYIEEYHLPPDRLSYRISEITKENMFKSTLGGRDEVPGEFKVWCGGGVIAHSPTLEQARHIIWTHHLCTLRAGISRLTNNLANYQRAQESLASDAMKIFKYRNWE